MLEGSNSSSIYLSDEEFEGFASTLSDISTVDGVLQNLYRRRETVINGGTNCIPLPFERFRSEVPGIEQGQYIVVTANQKTGKCFGKGTKVRMADNTVKNIEDLQVGDMLLSPNNEPPKVIEGLGQGKEMLYKIHSDFHNDLIVNENHIMYLYKCPGPRRKARYFTATVKELIELQKTVKNFRKYYQMVASDECSFENYPNLKIEPYFYGVWLGDGDTKSTYITSQDKNIVEYLRSYAERLGMKVSECKSENRCPKYTISRKSHKDVGFKSIFGSICEWQKEHINRDYINASIEDRYQLLAGIIDTDGYLNRNKTGYMITLQYESLVKDIQEIARSLGIESKIISKYNKTYNKYYYVIKLNGRNCYKIPTKVKHCKLSSRHGIHFSFSITPLSEGDYYGIVLGGNHLFLLEDYTVVHNTNLTDYVYLFSTLDYAFLNPDKCSVHIIYFALEEAVQKIIERYMSFLLWKLDGIRIAPSDLRSTSNEFPVPEEILSKLGSEPYQQRLKFFENCVQFETENTNPTGILRVCEKYAKSVGTYTSHQQVSNGLSNRKVEVFDSYVQNDPNHYKIAIIDHIGLVDKEQGYNTKSTVDKMSEYFVKYLRNRYNYTCVAIQQQASETEGLEAMKQKKMVPSAASLGDSKYTARDADLVLGLFDPSRFGLPQWLGYKIQDADGSGLRNYGRFMYVIANRNGEMAGVCPLFFDGAVCNFEELPKPDDINAVTAYYNRVKNIKSFKQQQKFKALTATVLILIKKILNQNNR